VSSRLDPALPLPSFIITATTPSSAFSHHHGRGRTRTHFSVVSMQAGYQYQFVSRRGNSLSPCVLFSITEAQPERVHRQRHLRRTAMSVAYAV
jgi:hypothetical protein